MTTNPTATEDGPSLSASASETPSTERDASPVEPQELAAAVEKLDLEGGEHVEKSTMESKEDGEGTPSKYFPQGGKSEWHGDHPLFEFEQLGVDRRLVRSLFGLLPS